MFGIPERYIKESKIDTKNFIRRDAKKPDKDRIRENLLSAKLIWQIEGEEIPSLINKDYHCSVIAGMEIKLKSIKDSVFFAELTQRLMKEPCVIRFYDKNDELFSFAHKRLSHTDNTQIVIEDRIETPPESTAFPGKVTKMLERHLAFDSLKNKNDKLSLYLEAAVKAYIISNLSLFSGMEALLDCKRWYNKDEILALFRQLKELEQLNAELAVEQQPGERARLMGEIKSKTSIVKGDLS